MFGAKLEKIVARWHKMCIFADENNVKKDDYFY